MLHCVVVFSYFFAAWWHYLALLDAIEQYWALISANLCDIRPTCDINHKQQSVCPVPTRPWSF